MPDAIFAEPRLAALYDAFDSDRSDLDAYVAMADEFGARSVLDVGCGTGTLACLLAQWGKDVTAVDPAAASLEVARRKSGTERVRWIEGDATTLPPLQVDMITMTGNVAQVFLTEDDWVATLGSSHAALSQGGLLVFESRDPAREAWQEWNREQTYERREIQGVGPVERWVELREVSLPFVSFETRFIFEKDGAVLCSTSTLRFRNRMEIEESLRLASFSIEDVRDAPDRPGLEFVFIARKSEKF